MTVPPWAWLLTLLGLIVLLALDLVIVDRHPHKVTLAEAGRWVVFYIAAALAFGAVIWVFNGWHYAGEFFSGYLTEYSLSVDNLVVFLLIMMAFKVPVIHQHRVLLIGIVIALVLRGVLILVGAVLITRFFAVFYLFGAFLIYTAYRMWRSRTDESHSDDSYHDNAVVRLLRRIMPVTREYDGAKAITRVEGRRSATPMLVVILAIGTTDLLFAFDSIPAVFGLTQESFLVFAVNAFALMGLRQLYFLIGGLLRNLVYLPVGLAVVLFFIGTKLILEVMHHDWQPFEPGNQALPVPALSAGVSLAVIAGVLAVTVAASLIKTHRTGSGPRAES